MHTPVTPSRVRPLLCAALIAVLAGCSPTSTTASLQAAEPEYAPGWNGVAVEGTPRMPEARFTDTEGRPFDLRAAAMDKPTLVYFGYTHCPDICPVHMANIASALDSSSVRPSQINVVLVTTDPDRDTPQVLGDYLDNFDASFIGLTAPQERINQFVVDLGLPEPVLEKPSDGATGDYTVGHPGQVLVFDAQARARIAYPWGTRQSQWVEDLPKLVRGDWA